MYNRSTRDHSLKEDKVVLRGQVRCCAYVRPCTPTHTPVQRVWDGRMLRPLEAHLGATMPRAEQPQWTGGGEVRVGPDRVLSLLST